jgi:hypothetical protein
MSHAIKADWLWVGEGVLVCNVMIGILLLLFYLQLTNYVQNTVKLGYNAIKGT